MGEKCFFSLNTLPSVRVCSGDKSSDGLKLFRTHVARHVMQGLNGFEQASSLEALCMVQSILSTSRIGGC